MAVMVCVSTVSPHTLDVIQEMKRIQRIHDSCREQSSSRQLGVRPKQEHAEESRSVGQGLPAFHESVCMGSYNA